MSKAKQVSGGGGASTSQHSSLSKGLNLGIVDQVSMQDCQDWVSYDDIKQSPQNGNYSMNKLRVIENLEHKINSPSTKNKNQLNYYSNQMSDPMTQRRNMNRILENVSSDNIALNEFGGDSQSNRFESTYKGTINNRSIQDRKLSPTFALTSDEPPYGMYPKLKKQLNQENSGIKQRQGIKLFQNILKLSKKCYQGEESDQMPWVKSKIDLSFPEIKKVHLDGQKIEPMVDKYLMLSYMRDGDVKMDKIDSRIQNKTINVNEESQQYFQNQRQAIIRKVEHDMSQIALFGDKTQRDTMPQRIQALEPIIRTKQNQSRSQSVIQNTRQHQQYYNTTNLGGSTVLLQPIQDKLGLYQQQPEDQSFLQPYQFQDMNNSAVDILIQDQIDFDNSLRVNNIKNSPRIDHKVSTLQKKQEEKSQTKLKLKLSKNKMYMVPDMSDKMSMLESLKRAKEVIKSRQAKNMNIRLNLNKTTVNSSGKQL
ncbi:UNKNOWN [Stylonychia lemnae]|uniref:Uncharacterized protein n=1 Tax=Stylonychia lemnae TaxID=5949 RepID=A0A078B9B4_STYLE|nr:UNKNOWN [Stylonychia lemnae]|eukprot:CDW89857.1 UNKNOWN [Stylonychia lemnae]